MHLVQRTVFTEVVISHNKKGRSDSDVTGQIPFFHKCKNTLSPAQGTTQRVHVSSLRLQNRRHRVSGDQVKTRDCTGSEDVTGRGQQKKGGTGAASRLQGDGR